MILVIFPLFGSFLLKKCMIWLFFIVISSLRLESHLARTFSFEIDTIRNIGSVNFPVLGHFQAIRRGFQSLLSVFSRPFLHNIAYHNRKNAWKSTNSINKTKKIQLVERFLYFLSRKLKEVYFLKIFKENMKSCTLGP